MATDGSLMRHSMWHRFQWGVLGLWLTAAVTGVVWISAYDQALDTLQTRTEADLTLASERVTTQLQIYRELAVLTVDHPVLGRLSHDTGQQAAATLLRSYADKTGALDIFYADRFGQVLAAADGDVATDVATTGYFKRAMQGVLAHEPRVLADGKRVYVFAAPDFGPDNHVRGVLVIAAEVLYLEQSWPGSLPAVYFTTQEGMVFISNRSELLFWQRLQAGPGLTPPAGTPSVAPPQVKLRAGHEIWKLGWSPYLPQNALHLAVDLPSVDMYGEILVDVSQAQRFATLQAAAVAALCLAIASLVFFTSERRRALALVNADLEVRVQQRTQDLQTANVHLTREIHERKEAEAALKRAQFELVRVDKLSALGRMSAGISHELNQPLMAIQQFAENGNAFLARQNLDRAGENLTRISDMAMRMGRIIKNMRAFARNESEPTGRVDLVKVIDDALELTQTRLHDCNVRLRWSPQPRGKVFVRGGEVRLTQVFVNLINNAIDAMLDQEERLITVSLETRNTVKVYVRDIGPGLHEPEKVFDPFYSTKTTSTHSSQEGMGLGLSISYGLVQSFGGNIHGENADEGAMFTVELDHYVPETELKTRDVI